MTNFKDQRILAKFLKLFIKKIEFDLQMTFYKILFIYFFIATTF